MSFSTILRRAASSVSSLTIPAIGSRAQNIKALNVHGHGRTIPFSTRYFCSASKSLNLEEENLISIIDSKINLESTTDSVQEIPGLPYLLHYPPKDDHLLLLKREFKNEKIEIKVSKQALEIGNDRIRLRVQISKDIRSSLIFIVDAFPHEIQLCKFSIVSKDSDDLAKFDNLNMSNVDANLKNALLKYLEVRELNHITINALRKHMSKKMDSLLWLKDLKGFLEK